MVWIESNLGSVIFIFEEMILREQLILSKIVLNQKKPSFGVSRPNGNSGSIFQRFVFQKYRVRPRGAKVKKIFFKKRIKVEFVKGPAKPH